MRSVERSNGVERSSRAVCHPNANRVTIAAAASLVAIGLLLAGCSSGEAESTVAVTGTDDSCDIAAEHLQAGKIAFEFTNEADDVNELYVLRADGDVVSEVENVTTGTTRSLTVDLVAGDYEVRCKPGQTGDGFATAFEVTGEGGSAQAKPDRTVTFDAVDFDYEQIDLSGIKKGETIRFEMTNSGDQPHEFEVLAPDGEAVGEIGAVDPGGSGGATITFGQPGEYSYQCILDDPDSGKDHKMLGMQGSFDVAA